MELLTEVERIKSVMGLILEKKKKLTRDEKFFWVAKNMGGWLYDEVYFSDYDLSRLPFFDSFKIYLIEKTNVNRNSRESIGKSLKDHYEDFLNVMDPQKSEDVIDGIKIRFPNIAQKIARYEKKELNPNEKRGRNRLVKAPKITSAIKSGRYSGDISKLKPLSSVRPQPQLQPEPVNLPEPEGGKRGRRTLERDFTPVEAGRWKREGIEQLIKIEKRIDKYEAQTVKFTNEIIRLQKELDRRKRFFGVDQEELNESIEKIKLDFKRFI
jgi:hypothetical protein